MLQKIIDKLEEETEKNINDMTLRVVCNHVIEICEADPAARDKVMAALENGKTLSGAVSAMRAEAKKTATGGCGVLTDKQGFAIVDEHFGITSADVPAQPETKKASIFDML